MQDPQSATPLIPCLRYRDAAAGVRWLCEVLGFEPRQIVNGDGNQVVHARLTRGNALIMVGQVDRTTTNSLMAQPDETPGARVTQSLYLVERDVAALHARVQASGAHVVMALSGRPGQQEFACRDTEGHVWSIGTFNPWVN